VSPESVVFAACDDNVQIVECIGCVRLGG